MNKTIRQMTLTAVLAAIIVILQMVGNYLTIGPVCINLSLVPIVVGAVLLGPWVGLFLGAFEGLIIILAPSTAGFMSISPVVTVILCLAKTGIAGLVAGFIPKAFKKHREIGVVLAAIATPIINSGLFALGCIFFFNSEFGWDIRTLFLVVIGFNFLIEIGINAVLAPTICYVVKIINNKRQKPQVSA